MSTIENDSAASESWDPALWLDLTKREESHVPG
jgi:hypothetical protein